MSLANRSLLAIVSTSLLFGSISVPYFYLALVAYTDPLIIVAWLTPCTALLLLIFISKTKLEERLARKLGSYFRPLIIALVIIALVNSYFIELLMMTISIFAPPVMDWFSLIIISGIVTAVAFVVVIATRPSRLEKIIAAKTSSSNKSYIFYRSVAYIGLVSGLIFVGSKLYQYYLYNELCIGIVDPECQVLFGRQH